MQRLLFVFALFLSMVSYGQDRLDIGLCDSLPPDLYERDLVHLKIENGQGYCRSYTNVLDERIANFVNLQSLTYSLEEQYTRDGMTLIENPGMPKEVASLKNLKKLTANVWVPEMFQMQGLEFLSLSVPYSDSLFFEQDFSSLKSLKRLDLNFYGGHHKDLSLKGIEKLENLEQVTIRFGSRRLISQLLSNPNLKQFSSAQSFDNVVFDFSRTPKLELLNISNCKMPELPASVYQLKNLKHLSLYNCQLKTLAKEIGQLQELESLLLSTNKLSVLPSSIAKCSSLKILSLDRNFDLTSLPKCMGKLEQLEVLTAGNCKLTSLPKSLSKCSQLRQLVMTKNQLEEVNLDFRNFKNMTVADLSYNKLESIPSSIFTLTGLTHVRLNDNKLTHLPKAILLKNVVSFDVHNNSLKDLPYDIGYLPKLEQLSVYNNQLTTLPTSLSEAVGLKTLYLGTNKLSEISDLSKLRSLRALELQDNNLKIFPKEVYDLPELERIWVTTAYRKIPGFKESEESPMLIFTDER